VLKFLNFRYHGNKGQFEEKFKDIVKWADAINPQTGARIIDVTVTRAEL